ARVLDDVDAVVHVGYGHVGQRQHRERVRDRLAHPDERPVVGLFADDRGRVARDLRDLLGRTVYVVLVVEPGLDGDDRRITVVPVEQDMVVGEQVLGTHPEPGTASRAGRESGTQPADAARALHADREEG